MLTWVLNMFKFLQKKRLKEIKRQPPNMINPPQNNPTSLTTKEGRLSESLVKALEKLNEAKPFAKNLHQDDVFQVASLLMESDAGIQCLYEQAHLFDSYGVFYGGPWQNPEKLRPELVRGSLDIQGVYPTLEILSELRMLAIAQGTVTNPKVTPEEAAIFLNKVFALNLDFFYPGDTEQSRIERCPNQATCERLFRFLVQKLSIENLRGDVISEIEQICVQRPIMTQKVRSMVELADKIPASKGDAEAEDRLKQYVIAVKGISPLSKDSNSLSEYRQRLMSAAPPQLEAEAEHFADSMHYTVLSSPNHAVMIRYLLKEHPELLPKCLGLKSPGIAEFEKENETALRLIQVAIQPTTYRAIYGFANILERSLLSRTEISNGLIRLVDVDLCLKVQQDLRAERDTQDGVTANAFLVAGVIMVLGQPLGIGQGKNATCQAARGISLWSQHASGYLIKMLISAAREGFIEIPFEGDTLQSNQFEGGLAPKLDMDLDPVSIVLVPHLDRVYDEMMRRTLGRSEDGHKWVNPALYGQWVSTGFSSVFDVLGHVVHYEDFVRRFYATHHPSFNHGHKLMYPNPVGLLITNAHGELLGPHAVSVQRVAMDPDGNLRVYFYNPNNEGRQDWGQEIHPSVRNNGELEGESSLPFDQFVSRLYAYHFNPYEVGEAFAVPAEVVASIESLARESWGKSYTWL